jgi:hypothetical protein
VATADGKAGKAPIRAEERSALSGVVLSQKGMLQAGVPVTFFRGNVLMSETVTNAQGEFRFEKLPFGVYTLVVPEITVSGIALDGSASRSIKLTQGAAGGRCYTPTRPRLLPEDETAGRRVIYGIVSDASGAGINGIKVRLSWSNAGPDADFPVEVTGRQPDKPAGYYEFITTPGVFSLTVVQGDWPSASADRLDTIDVLGREGQPISYEVDFHLQAVTQPGRLEGTAPGAQSGRAVKLTGAGAGSAGRTANLDADGRFVFDDLTPGSYLLALEGVGVVADNIVVDAGRLYRLFFPLQSQVAGQVDGARPGAIAVLYAPPIWGWTRQAPLDAAGRFTFGGLPAARYRLQIPGAETLSLELNGVNRLDLPAIDLAEGQRGVLRGRVVSPSGRAIEGAEVGLWRDGAGIATTHTPADGAYRFANLPAGGYSLLVAGMGEVLKDLALDGESEHRHDLLWLSGTIAGRVLSADGKPQAGQTVLLLRDGAEVMRVASGAEGAFQFAALSPGAYALSWADGVPIASGIEVAAGVVLTQDLRLPAKKPFAHYLWFPAADEQHDPGGAMARLALALTWRYLRKTGATGGFSLDEAVQADQVTVVGRHLSAEDKAALQAAGCQVSRLPEEAEALAAAIEQLTVQAGEG